ncbi:hypothetical protein CG747_34340 [Streptomyces sp. CB02959]|nr:hypothetical protein CG747_34340 [Streptomyces sp. CB02959]
MHDRRLGAHRQPLPRRRQRQAQSRGGDGADQAAVVGIAPIRAVGPRGRCCGVAGSEWGVVGLGRVAGVRRVGRSRRRRRSRCAADLAWDGHARSRTVLRPTRLTAAVLSASTCGRRGIRHTTPEKTDSQAARLRKGARGARPPAFDEDRYKRRNTVERTINRLKQSRAVATRYDKRGYVFLGTATATSVASWLRT